MGLSIVTAVSPQRAAFLPEAEASVRRLRDVMDIEWIVVWDGQASLSVEEATAVVEAGEPGGIAVARNMALPHLTSTFTTILDADDTIEVAGCVAAIEAFVEDPALGWIGLSRTFLDGCASKHTITQGERFKAGELAERWNAPFVFHPNSVVVRTELLLRCGGWPALKTNEDLAMVLAVSEEAGGMTVPEVITRYRVWDGQEVARPSYSMNKKAAFAYLQAVINARRREKHRSPIEQPREVGSAFGREALS